MKNLPANKAKSPISNHMELAYFVFENCQQCKKAFLPNSIVSDSGYRRAIKEGYECALKHDIESCLNSGLIQTETFFQVFREDRGCKKCQVYEKRNPNQDERGINEIIRENPGQLKLF